MQMEKFSWVALAWFKLFLHAILLFLVDHGKKGRVDRKLTLKWKRRCDMSFREAEEEEGEAIHPRGRGTFINKEVWDLCKACSPQVLREEACKHIGDTGLLNLLLKHMAGRVPEGSVHWFRRRHNADGAMEYWLELDDLAELRRQAGVSDPYWVPPPGWKPDDDMSLVAGDLLVTRQVEELTEEVNGIKRQMEQLMCKDDGDFDAERAYNSLKERYQRAVRVNEKEKQVCCLKDMCENMVQMNDELKKEMSSFKDHIVDKSDKLEEQITSLSNSFLSFKDQLVLALKMETERRFELAPSEAFPRTALYVGSGGQMIPWTDGAAIQGVQDRPVKKSSFHVRQPQGTFLWPSMASSMTISGGASSSCPAATTPGPGIPHSTSCLSSAGPGLPLSSQAPVEVVAAVTGLDEHVMFGALFSTPSSASSTNADAAAAKLQPSLLSPRSPLQPQKLFGTVTAASGFSPQKMMHFSGLTRRHLDTTSSSSRASGSSLQEGKSVLFDAVAGGISAVGTELALATPSC